MLAKTGSLTYKIQYSAEAEPELVHVDKLLPYQADFGEELQSWLQDEELGGHNVAGMQTDQPASPSNSLPEPSTHTVGGSPPDPGAYERGSEVEDEQPLTLIGTPRRSRYTCNFCNFGHLPSFMPKYGNFENRPVSQKPLPIEQK